MDRIISVQDGFDCIVGNRQFGTWRSRGEAAAGMATEQRRLAEREEAESQRLMAQTDATIREYHEWRMRDVTPD